MQIIFSLVIFVLLVFSPDSLTQKMVVPVWNYQIPGSKTNPAYHEDTLFLGNGQIRIYRVTNPRLTIYPAPGGNSASTAIIIAPGGGYSRLAMDNEGNATAEWLNSIGITAIVLIYRLPNDTIMTRKDIGPLQDAQEAIRVVRRNAKIWNINPNKIGFMGFSAGGHLAASISTHFSDKVYDSDTISARPDFTILMYPVISMESIYSHTSSRQRLLGKNPPDSLILYHSTEKQVTSTTPPTFIAHANNDSTVQVQQSIAYYESLLKNHIPVEFHIFQSGGHGFGLGRGGTENSWTGLCANWMKVRGILK